MVDVTGTAEADRIDGSAADEVIRGLEGNDTIYGNGGNDIIYGGDGSDRLDGGDGNDLIDGGEDADYLYDTAGGSDTLIGGSGDDNFELRRNRSTGGMENIRVDGGIGNDQVYLSAFNSGTAHSNVAVDLGDGDDRLTLASLWQTSVRATLGAGRDVVTLPEYAVQVTTATITDFAAGVGGDVLDIGRYLGTTLINWDNANPFGATGFLRLIQSGSSTLLQVDRDGTGGGAHGWFTLVVLENTRVADFRPVNFGGYAPDGSALPAPTLIASPAGGRLDGTVGNDTMLGQGGADWLDGGNGSDVINGGGGDDSLAGGFGDDTLDGGDGNDNVIDFDSGSDTLRGGAGNDYIVLSHDDPATSSERLVIEAGSGDDDVTFITYNYNATATTATIDLGDGDDRLRVIAMAAGSLSMTLGAGRDTLTLDGSAFFDQTPEITDFATGAAGDTVDLSLYLSTQLVGWTGGNPFGAGRYLRLTQSGAHTLLQVDRDGAGSGFAPATLLILRNTTAGAFTAVNFAGYAPDGSAVAGQTITGTALRDELQGTIGGDAISGLGGDDLIYGRAGDDLIEGGEGADTIDGGAGNDVLEGGAGDDSLYDADSGSDTLRGGDGDDYLVVRHYGSTGLVETIRIEGGDGNDRVEYQSYNGVAGDTAVIDLGTGDDQLAFYNSSTAAVTAMLGAGADVIRMGYLFDYGPAWSITDFVVGAAGDRVDWGDLLGRSLLNWNGSNPFGSGGYLRVSPSGGDVLLQVDRDGAAGSSFAMTTLLVLRNVALDQLTAFNLGGYNKPVLGTAGADQLTGDALPDYMDGGLGADRMEGGGGNDEYVVDNAGDTVVEAPGGGTDTVRSSVSYVLPDAVENLVLTGSGLSGTGNALNNLLIAGAGDVILAGLDGNDAFYMGATLTASDRIDGGAGTDAVAIQGNYAGLTLGAASLIGVEGLTLLTHTDTRFGGSSASPFSYNLSSVDANVAAGQTLKVNASVLAAGEAFTFNGAAETDGAFFIYGGKGVDTLTGGRGADLFFFAEDGRFAATDRIDGGAGADIVVLRGDYDLTLTGTSLVNVETVALSSGSDARFYAPGTPFSYRIATADSTVAANATMTINGALLLANERFTFDGSAESNGAFRLFAGAADDSLRGGAGADLIFGGLGADTLTGGAGADVFRYQNTSESTQTSRDTVTDFTLGDLLDLSRIDANTGVAGDQAFAFIGAGAFTGTAGQLRAVLAGGQWTVEADTDGDGAADLSVLVTVADGHALTGADFVL